MWSLKPYKSPPSVCPGCQAENEGFQGYSFTGVHIMGRGVCTVCGMHYYHNWPIGHGADFPVSFNDNGKAMYPKKAAQWLAKPLIRAIQKGLRVDAPVKREVRKNISHALLLNCLDPCYGHVLWKLFNVSRYCEVEPPQGLIVLIPANCTWMVPDYVAEVWSVEVRLGALYYQVTSVEQLIREVCDSFESLQILPVATHIDHATIDLQQFLPVKPFRLEEFYSKPASITLIWREDRYWLRSVPEHWLGMAARKFSMKLMISWLLFRQLRTMINVAKYVRQEIPEIKFRVTGLGTWGSFPGYFEDLRQQKLTESWEKRWCQVYADSQIIIGVHGSNMLIPTALSAGFIELLPRYKIPFLTEDILLKHPPRFQMFLGRHLDIFTSGKIIARHVISIFRDFDYLYKNTLERL